jgi:predicted Zn finger-like uncharacterized protein
MLTQCPQCRTTFRVTREILRVADGQVRCGRCQMQFDALERLLEEEDDLDIPSSRFLRQSGVPADHEPDTSPPARASLTPSFDALNDAWDDTSADTSNEASNDMPDDVPDTIADDGSNDISGDISGDIPDDIRGAASNDILGDISGDILAQDSDQEPVYEIEIDASHEEITLEGRHIEISGTYQVVDDTGHGRLEVREESFQEEWAEVDEPESHAADDALWPAYEDDLVGVEERPPDDHPDADLRKPFAGVTIGTTSADDRLDGNRRDPDSPVDDGQQAVANDNADPLQAPADDRQLDGEEEDFLPTAHRRSTLPWKILFLPLLLLLVAQVIHDNRAMLARHPRLGPPLTEIYRLLGLDLQPEWDLHAYEVRQWGIVSDPAAPGTLRVRASIRNLASFPQPYPLLKLVLEDRWGEQVRARAFEPVEYLDPSTAPDRLLAPAQLANATIIIVDPGPDAEGFHFDVCLRGPAGLACAANLPRH